jgi:rubrerythrin
MTENEQINEMAVIIDDNHGFVVSSVNTAKSLYSKGYRKVERGNWNLIGNGNGRPIHWKCSVCGYETLDAANGDTNFCPNCGADMRGEEDA